MDEKPKARRGFATMDPEKRRKIASMGGKSVPAEKRSFAKDRTLARVAGKKGGQSVPDAKRTFSKDKDLAKSAGRVGGLGGLRKADAPRS